MKVFEVYYRANSSVEVTLIVVAESKSDVIEWCFQENYEEKPRETFNVHEIYSTEGITPLPKQIYRHSEEQH